MKYRYLKVDFGEKYYNLFVKRITPHLGKGSCCEFCWDIFNGTLCEKSGNKSSPNMCSTRYTSASGTSIAQQVVILSLARPLFLMSPLQYGDLWIIFIEWFLYWKGVMLWIILKETSFCFIMYPLFQISPCHCRIISTLFL